MKLSTEVYTPLIKESKEFYCRNFNFKVKFEIDGFVVLQHKIDTACKLLFCVPDSPFVNEIFRPKYSGEGIIFQIEVDEVTKVYDDFKNRGVPIALDLVDEPVNGKHFTVSDPNGILIDIVQY
ncbi:VOC family protein [Ekhidna sp.]|uniref:VOC family protein n=1 Tax=Ekhidna sp. TaxID=2608089 RepID=UPI003519AE7E